MSTAYTRPPVGQAQRVVEGARVWKEALRFRDGRIYDFTDIRVYLFATDDSLTGEFHRISYCRAEVIERTAQCYIEFAVNIWPSAFDAGRVGFEDDAAHFTNARRKIWEYLATASPQRGYSEYNWPIQLHCF